MNTEKQKLTNRLIEVSKIEEKSILYIPDWELAMFVDEFIPPSDSGVNPMSDYQVEGYTYPDLNTDKLFTSGNALRRMPDEVRELEIQIPPHTDFILIKTKI